MTLREATMNDIQVWTLRLERSGKEAVNVSVEVSLDVEQDDILGMLVDALRDAADIETPRQRTLRRLLAEVRG